LSRTGTADEWPKARSRDGERGWQTEHLKSTIEAVLIVYP